MPKASNIPVKGSCKGSFKGDWTGAQRLGGVIEVFLSECFTDPFEDFEFRRGFCNDFGVEGLTLTLQVLTI